MRNIVVTGGSRGLGLGIAQRLAGAGYRAIAIARKETNQLTLAREAAEREPPGSLAFARSLAREVGRMNVTVNAVAPGFIDTDMTQGLAPAQREQIARRSALRRLPDVGDVADAVEFLLGDKAKSITGTVLTVDAGNT